ncbi:hypothetical protein BDZ94DRAFT_1296338 [Collybia nuda]|uniref:Uncharacterized protein n=1 Tax=Collybia nuda TaxID=64659 RepID=A0A9P5YBS4_9AGAR|nr:hypothetical protein BDZ94DRAFT_1296338 [Collybia nuda]
MALNNKKLISGWGHCAGTALARDTTGVRKIMESDEDTIAYPPPHRVVHDFFLPVNLGRLLSPQLEYQYLHFFMQLFNMVNSKLLQSYSKLSLTWRYNFNEVEQNELYGKAVKKALSKLNTKPFDADALISIKAADDLIYFDESCELVDKPLKAKPKPLLPLPGATTGHIGATLLGLSKAMSCRLHLFSIMHEAGHNDIVKFAIQKLFGHLTHENEDGVLAALCIKLLLEFNPLHKMTKNKEVKLVAGYMCVIYSVPQHALYLCSGTPSEPLLAEAVAQIMVGKDPLSLLQDYLSHGLISKGEQRELISCLLLMLACDKALKWQDGKQLFSEPIGVIEFLEALIGNNYIDSVKKLRPTNILNDQNLEEAFSDAQINFTHFVKGGDSDTDPTNERAEKYNTRLYIAIVMNMGMQPKVSV